jgi:hypothetical protein
MQNSMVRLEDKQNIDEKKDAGRKLKKPSKSLMSGSAS